MAPLKKIPQRKCSGCGLIKGKKELLRIVRKPDGEICVDISGKVSGRGAYLCPENECLKKAVKAKRIERSLETQISDEIYTGLEAQIKAYKAVEPIGNIVK